MGIDTYKAIKELTPSEFKDLIRDKNVALTQHTLDHLSNAQRKVFKIEELMHMIDKERPRKAYEQFNGYYAAYYRRDKGYRKLIFDIQEKELIIVSFIDTVDLPKINL